MAEEINHPHRYNQGGIECIDAMKAATVNKKGIEAICVSNVIRYLWRYEEKGGRQDIEKALWYLNRLLDETNTAKDAATEQKAEKECKLFDEELCCCDYCKHYDDGGYDDELEVCTEEPCKSCKNNFVPNTKAYKEAPYNFVCKFNNDPSVECELE